jgi:MoxR-like ATPase
MTGALSRLRTLLDRHVVGHDEVKDALLLGLVCREHIYLEGPPGTAKTRMAEIAARGSSLGFFFYQLHRDTRLQELVGDVVLERRPVEGEDGERIHQRIQPGGILTAEVCVLDDISRAPGEALNVLLRILNERRFGEDAIPLLTAIATSNPMRDEYYNEPLDPANLDRFAIQLSVTGLLQGGDEERARFLVDRFAEGEVIEQPETEVVCDRETFEGAFAALQRIDVPDRVKDALLEVYRILVFDYDCSDTNSLLTDRSFLVKAIKLLRGRALLAGRKEAEMSDLDVLRWMTTYRVPPPVHQKLPEIITQAAAKARAGQTA